MNNETNEPSALRLPTSASAGPVLSARGVTKTYRKGAVEVPVLRGAELDVAEGEMLAIVGQSGSGKSTLLHVLGTLDRADAGSVHYRGERVDTMKRSERDAHRRRELGMIFQAYHLLPELSALENVLAPAMIRYGVVSYLGRRRGLRQRATDLLDRVGLSHRLTHKPRELSGGEMQRTAIARALMNGPRLLLADEPTGNLDPASGDGVLDLLCDLNQTDGLTVVMVTHDRSIAARADRAVTLIEGRVAVDSEGPRLRA